MKIPLFPLDVVLFPGAALPLHIFEERYKEMIGDCMAQARPFGVVRAQSQGLAVIGCTAEIVRQLEKYPDGRVDILCRGADRFEIENLDNSRSFLQAEADFFTDDGALSSREAREQCAALHFEVLELIGIENVSLGLDLNQPISFHLASALPCDLGFKQELLALRSDAERTERLLAFYRATVPKLRRGTQMTQAAAGNRHVM
jgi:Lon protease-like protein